MPKAGSYHRVVIPAPQKTIGQGEPLIAFVCTVNGVRYEFPKGLVVQASSKCDPENGVANLSSSPPLVRTSFIEEHSDNFEPMQSPEE